MLHNLANYPKDFIGCVVSKGKICLQFGNVEVKLRYKEGGEFIKLPDTTKAFPVPITGTKIDIASVGCSLPIITMLLDDVIGALAEHYALHTEAVDKLEYIANLERISNYLSGMLESMKKEIKCPKKVKKLKQLS